MAKKQSTFEENLKEMAAMLDRRWAKQHPLTEHERELFRLLAEQSWDWEEKARKLTECKNTNLSKRDLLKLVAQATAQIRDAKGPVPGQPRVSSEAARTGASEIARSATKQRTGRRSVRRTAGKSSKSVKGHKH